VLEILNLPGFKEHS